jgi:hypothetical protein
MSVFVQKSMVYIQLQFTLNKLIMKKQIIILLAIVSILVSSCSKEEIRLNRDYSGVAQALKNEKKWKPFIYATHNRREPNYIYITMDIYNKQGFERESLALHHVPKKEGMSLIKPRDIIENFEDENNIRHYSSYYTSIADGDVTCSSYQVDDSVEVAGYVNVTKYDEKSGKIEGTFEVTLVKERSCETDAPDTLHFTNGVFSTKVQN